METAAAPLVPPALTKVCLLAAALTPGDVPIAGRHPWEHNNLAQKNIVVGSARAGEFFAFAFSTRGGFGKMMDRGRTIWSSDDMSSAAARRFEGAKEISLPRDKRGKGLPVSVARDETLLLAVRIWVPADARPEAHLVKRTARGVLAGGVAVRVEVR